MRSPTLIAIGLTLLLSLAGCTEPPAPAARADGPGLRVAELLSSNDNAGFRRAIEPRRFSFPADHGPHPGFRTEWWYLTGNLASPEGRRFGYQLTFFKNELTAEPTPRMSAWATHETWMAHFAVVDVDAERFHAFERFSRGALGLAGAVSPPPGTVGQPFEVWLEDWRLEHSPATDVFRLRAADGGVELALEARPVKPPVLQGDRGLSAKGRAPGNASYYYSLTRMASRGTLRVGAAGYDVEGTSWMDREWSTSALEEGQVGWDWFALQLDDGRELMFYGLRRTDGSIDPISAGTLVDADGGARRLTAADVRLSERRRWTSDDGVAYPVAWRLEIPTAGLVLDVDALVDDQEHRGTFRYWEGAVEVAGTAAGAPLAGVGYVELTGYADLAYPEPPTS